MRIGSAVALGFLGIVVVAIGRVFGLLEMFVIGSGLVLTSVLAVVSTRARIVLVDVLRRPTTMEPRVGDDIAIELAVRAVRRSPGFRLREEIVDSTGSILGQVDVSIPPLRRDQKANSRYRFSTDRRGVVTLGPATVRYGDPLGLARWERTTGLADEIVVSPHWDRIALPEPANCEGELVNEILRISRSTAADLEFKSLREYAPGDDARFVNWRASSRRDVLIVNEFESRSDIVLDVLLDVEGSCYSPQGFERAVSIAASFVGSSGDPRESEVRVKLTFGEGEGAEAFSSLIDDKNHKSAMRSLALLVPSVQPSLPTRAKSQNSLSVPVLICGRRDFDWLEGMRSEMRSSSVAVAIFCEADDAPDGTVTRSPNSSLANRWFVVDAAQGRPFVESWAVLSRRIRTA